MFFNIVGPLTLIWSLAVVAIVGRVVSAIILGWGWCRLNTALKLSRTETVCSAALLGAISLTGSFSGEWILGGFESKVPAFGFAFAAVGTWMRCSSEDGLRSWIVTGVFTGVAIGLHPVVGGWFLIGMGMATIAETILMRWTTLPADRTSLGRSFVSLSVMNLAAATTALPGLIPVLQMLSSSTLPPTAPTADRIQVFVRLRHHLDPTRFPPNAWLHAGILLLVVLAGSWWLRKSEHRPELLRFLLLLAAAVVIAVVGVAVGWHREPVADLQDWSGRALLLKFYPFRFVDTVLPVAAAMILAAVAGKAGAVSFRRARWTEGLIILVLAAAFVTRQRTPSGYSAAAYTEWRQACRWIRENVPAESLIFTPRESFAFKWLAERPEYVCYKDCPQDAAGILEWYHRLQSVEWLDPQRLEQPLAPADLRRLRSETGATHMITRRFTVRDEEPVFQNSIWRIYDVRSLGNVNRILPVESRDSERVTASVMASGR